MLYFDSYPSQDYHGNAGSIVISNQTHPGHILVTIGADVSELYASKDVTSRLALATLDAQKLTYESRITKT